MLEAPDNNCFEIVSSFLGVIVDQCCGRTAGADLKMFTTPYIDTGNSLYRWGKSSGWTKVNVDELKILFKELMYQIAKNSSRYQRTGFAKSTFYALKHRTDSIRDVGVLEYSQKNHYEMSYKLFNTGYELTWNRASCAMKETLLKEKQPCYGHECKQNIWEKCAWFNKAATTQGRGVLVKTGTWMFIALLQACFKLP